MVPYHAFRLSIPQFHGNPVTDGKRPPPFEFSDISPFHTQFNPPITDHPNRSNIPETTREFMLRRGISPPITETNVITHNIPIPHVRVPYFSRSENVCPVKVFSPRDVPADFTIHHRSHFPVNPYCPTILRRPVSHAGTTD